MSILVNFLKEFRFCQNLRKSPIFSKISKNIDLGQIIEKLRFWSNFRKISIRVKIFDFFENFEKFRFWTNFRVSRFWTNYRKKFRFQSKFSRISKMSILENFLKNFDFGQNFEEFSSKLSKISILVKFSKNFDFGQILTKISIFGQNCLKFRKISILVKFSTNFEFCQIFEKFRF